MILNNIKAAIFDLDGTLIDSLGIWHKIDIEYLKSKNLSVTEDLHKDIGHLSFYQTAEYFKKRFNIQDSVETIMNTWNDMAFKFYSTSTPLKNGAKEFLEYLKYKGIKIGLATSNSKHLLEAALKQNEIYNLFDSITTTSEVDNGKDKPDVYLLSAKKLNVSPKNCIVFEDLLIAIKSAKSIGMKTIAIEDIESIDDKNELISISDKYILDYIELLKELSINA